MECVVPIFLFPKSIPPIGLPLLLLLCSFPPLQLTPFKHWLGGGLLLRPVVAPTINRC